MTNWIDTHCHLDAPEFGIGVADAVTPAVMRAVTPAVARAAAAGVVHCVIPAVAANNFETVRLLAEQFGYSYALGIHPGCVPQSQHADLDALDAELAQRQTDPRLVAVGEIGLDFFVPELMTPAMRERQETFYLAQLKLAKKYKLPVILHVRRSADRLLKYLRAIKPGGGWQGIAHAFNGSQQQAQEFIKLGFKLGFGGGVTFEAALQLRRLAENIPLSALVMETDSPDIPPHWLYTTAADRALGTPQARNEPAQLPRIAQHVADLRGMSLSDLAAATTANALQALPKLAGLNVFPFQQRAVVAAGA